MSSQAIRSSSNSHYDFFARSGFDVLPEEPGYYGYARQLARYITDPSTVRVRVLDQFGSAPHVDEIRTMRAEWLATIKRRANAIGTYGTSKERKRAEEKARKLAALPPKVEEVPTDSNKAMPAPVPVAVACLPIALVPPRKPMLTGAEVIAACAAECFVTASDLTGPSRKKHLVVARNLAAAVLRARGSSLTNIGRFTNREHTTVLHNLRGFFDRDILDDRYLRAWTALAPDAAKDCRTLADLNVVLAA